MTPAAWPRTPLHRGPLLGLRHDRSDAVCTVAAHSELCWLLNCVTPLNWLERMIQFKEKAVKQGDNVSVGLLDYPVLMAADILLYDADLVPGEDQQHPELARDIAQQRINARFGDKETPVLKVPKPLILREGARVMSLTDGRSKMSKAIRTRESIPF